MNAVIPPIDFHATRALLPRVVDASHRSTTVADHEGETRPQLTRERLQKGDYRGTTFKHYVIEEKIGAGGMGEVFKAFHPVLGKRFAVKFLADEIAASPEAAARFLREAQAIGKLSHPNIVSAADAGQVDDLYFLATEYLEGIDLSRSITETSNLPMATACDYIRQAALGLFHAHQQGFVHRDIKPSNLFVDSTGTVKILDFGIARHLEEEASLTSRGSFMGTVDFISPEQAADPLRVGPSSDIYSLGCTFLFLLSGQTPYADAHYPSAISKLKGHMMDPPPWLAANAVRLPRPLASLLRGMLEKSPDDRLASCQEIADRLEHWLASQKQTALPTTLTSDDWHRGQRRRATFVTLAVGLSLGSLAVWDGLRVGSSPNSSRSEAMATPATRVIDEPPSADASPDSRHDRPPQTLSHTSVRSAAAPSFTLQSSRLNRGNVPLEKPPVP